MTVQQMVKDDAVRRSAPNTKDPLSSPGELQALFLNGKWEVSEQKVRWTRHQRKELIQGQGSQERSI